MNQSINTSTSFLKDSDANAQSAFYEKLIDALTPGAEIEFSPNEAFMAGAFIEDALTEEEASESDMDLLDAMPSISDNDEKGAINHE